MQRHLFPLSRGGFSRLWLIKPISSRPYFTNTDAMKREDPYAPLGLTWGATVTEIKEAYRQKARELHPDVSKEDPANFQRLQKAYQTLLDVKGAPHRDDLKEEWSFAVWRNSDVLAQERTDVAGVKKKRPAKPAESIKNPNWGGLALGHPNGGGVVKTRGEYLGAGTKKSSTVGTGRNKWVTPKEFKPWNPKEATNKRASDNVLGSHHRSNSTTSKG